MKVIKEGNFSSIFPMRITCKRVVDKYGFDYGEEKDFCGSELEIEASDLKKKKWSKYPDYEGTDYGVICPVCNRFVVVDANKIPKSILNNIKDCP